MARMVNETSAAAIAKNQMTIDAIATTCPILAPWKKYSVCISVLNTAPKIYLAPAVGPTPVARRVVRARPPLRFPSVDRFEILVVGQRAPDFSETSARSVTCNEGLRPTKKQKHTNQCQK